MGRALITHLFTQFSIEVNTECQQEREINKMKIPNATQAVVDIEKLQGYCLNPDHPRGKHKARLFASVLGLTAAEAEELRTMLLNIVRTHDAIATDHDQYGKRYVIEFSMATKIGRAEVRSSWIIRQGEEFPRFTSCYVLKKGGDING